MRIAIFVLPLILTGAATLVAAQDRPAAHSADVKSVALSHNGERVLTGGDTRGILWDRATGKTLRAFQHSAPVMSVSLSGDGKLALTGSNDGVSILWDAAGGKKLQTLNGPKGVRETRLIGGKFVEVHPDTGPVAISDNGKLIVTASLDHLSILWDAGSGKQLHTLRGHTATVMNVAVSDDGKLVATASADNTVILWDAASGKAVRKFEGHTGTVNCVSLSTDGKRLASGSSDGTAVFWDTDSGKNLQAFKDEYKWVSSASLSGDGKYLATAGGFIHPPVILWNAETGEKLHALGPKSRVIVSRDGKFVVTYGGRLLEVWETATGKKAISFDLYQ